MNSKVNSYSAALIFYDEKCGPSLSNGLVPNHKPPSSIAPNNVQVWQTSY